MSYPLSAECSKTPLTGQNLKDNTPALAQAMGLNEKCQKKADAEFSTGSISGNLSIPFVNLSAQAGFTQSNSAMAQAGCGQFFLNAKNVNDIMNNMSCTISSNTTTSNTNVQSNASISINVNVSDEYLAQLAESRNMALKTLNKITTAVTMAQIEKSNLSAEQIEALESSQKAIVESLEPPKNIISNVKFNAKAGGQVVTKISINSTQQEQLASDYKSVANAVAQNHIQTHLGDQAMDPNTKNVVKQNINNQTNNLQSNISKAVNSMNLNVNNDSNIVINSNIPIDIENTVFDANALVNIVVNHLTKNAIADGITAANNVLSNASSSTESTTSSAGVDELAKQLANIQKSQETGAGAGSGFPWYVYLIIGIIVLGLIGGGMFAVQNSDKIATAVQKARTPKI